MNELTDPAALWDADNLPLHWTPDLTPAVCGMTLKQCETEIHAGIKQFQGAFDNAVTAAVRIGHAALSAKDLVPQGKWVQWLDDNVKTMSGTWIRVCMRAAEVSDRLATRADRDAIIAHAGKTVEGMAALLPWLKQAPDGEAPPAMADMPKRARGPNLGTAPTPTPGDEGQGDPGRMATSNETYLKQLQQREEALDRRAKVLDAKETRLIAKEDELNERERNLAMREARHPAEVIDVVSRETSKATTGFALQPEQSLDAVRAMAKTAEDKRAAKAAAKATPAAGTAAKPKGRGTPAPKEKTAPTQPIVAATQHAAPNEVM